MQSLPLYPFHPSPNFSRFVFTSPGPPLTEIYIDYKLIKKQGSQEIYNLAFGPLDEDGEIDDSRILNFGDTEIILATIANSCIQFLSHHPLALVFFKGLDERRTNLYVRKIRRYFPEISKNFVLVGLNKNSRNWEAFAQTNQYEALIISQK